MENAVEMISSIDLKVKRLIAQYEELKEKLRHNQDQKEELRIINENQQKEIVELKEKLKLLKIAKTTEKQEGTADARLKINEMVREIDKCIGLLKG